MAGALRRVDLQAAAQAKSDDAIILLRHNRYSNAFYLSGYAIELGLKACISRQISAETIPDRNLVRDIFVHEFKKLVALAGLTNELKKHEIANTNFSANWGLAAQWSPDARYEAVDSYTAQLMIEAVAHPTDGVLQWIKGHW
jgi:HEPN domain-containing protein